LVLPLFSFDAATNNSSAPDRRALMINWTVGAEGIAQKADSAEEMHPEQK
jgi:hypothetical protein